MMRTQIVLGCFGLAAITACHGVVSNRLLANAFNGGALDGQSDPFYDPSTRAVDTVAWRMRDELGQAYFGQGGADARVVKWLAYLEAHAADFMREFVANALAPASTPSSNPPEELAGDAEGPEAREPPISRRSLKAALEKGRVPIEPPTERLCADDKPDAPNTPAIQQLLDYVRFQVALQRAAAAAAQLVGERFATMDEAIAGARRAFGETATYLANRQWRRDSQHPVTGLVVKGGAATGIFSAGAAYVALNMVHECIKAGKCAPEQSGFTMASGTSTGATVVTAADIFHTTLTKNSDCSARATALHDYLGWYLCSSMNDLYCVRDGVVFNLARSSGSGQVRPQDSFLDFDGLAAKVEGAYRCGEMNNGMELLLNTVDFRTGRLYSLSDQDPSTLRAPWDVAKAVVSSAALPFIVRPTYNLPIDPAAGGRFAYLDGGIRSELPLLALVRRGVERLLLVSSSASTVGDVAHADDALSMAIRYIDVSTGGVTEAEIDHALTRAQASRLAEYEYCEAALQEDRSAKRNGGAGSMLCTGHCDDDYLCAGNVRRACGRDPKRKRLSNDQIVAQTFQMTSIWRNEERVAGLPGYDFEPDQQRRLMLAGMEGARDQCRNVASALGIEGVDDETLYRWCTPRLPSTLEQCGAELVAKLKSSPDAPTCSNDEGPTPVPSTGSVASCPRVP